MRIELDKDKVIKGLDYCLRIGCKDDDGRCPYFYNNSCSEKLYDDVRELISQYEDAIPHNEKETNI